MDVAATNTLSDRIPFSIRSSAVSLFFSTNSLNLFISSSSSSDIFIYFPEPRFTGT